MQINSLRNRITTTHAESHANAVSLLKGGEWRYIKGITNNSNPVAHQKIGF